MATVSLGVLGMMGAILSITGIFGMAAYSVSKRLKELGIRVALGAQRKEVLQAALGRAFKLSACDRRCWLSLCIRPRRAILWSWLVWFWQRLRWDCWPRVFRRSVRYPSIP
jgi:hypothetical protein